MEKEIRKTIYILKKKIKKEKKRGFNLIKIKEKIRKNEKRKWDST